MLNFAITLLIGGTAASMIWHVFSVMIVDAINVLPLY